MIDKIIFGQLMSELSKFYNRPLSDTIKRIYYQSLGELTTPEFEAAVENAVLQCRFFPTPNELITFVKGDNNVFALEEYLELLAIASGQSSEEQLGQLTPHCLKALNSIGGLKRIKNELEDKLYGNLQAEFIKRWSLYKQAIEVKSVELPKPMLPIAKQEQEKPKQEDYMPRSDVGKMMHELKDIIKNKKNNSNDPENS